MKKKMYTSCDELSCTKVILTLKIGYAQRDRAKPVATRGSSFSPLAVLRSSISLHSSPITHLRFKQPNGDVKVEKQPGGQARDYGDDQPAESLGVGEVNSSYENRSL